MITILQGIVVKKNEQEVTILVSGIGFLLQMPHPECCEIQKEVTLYTYLHWNQESGPHLFGFSSELEKTVFLLIISCSGIGPKIALAILSELSPALFLQAIHNNDEKILSSVSGIGAKKAEQLIVSLRHKVSKLISSGILQDQTHSTEAFEQWTQVIQVLQSLNYSRTEIDSAMNYLRTQHTSAQTFDFLLRSSLSFLSKKTMSL